MEKSIYWRDGVLRYTGEVNDQGQMAGKGKSFYRNGKVYMEGVFDRKGLIEGREYYPNGQIRFEGTYGANLGYGPNYPVRGTYYNQWGELRYTGEFKVARSGLGYPFVEIPEDFGYVITEDAPRDSDVSPRVIPRDRSKIHSEEEFRLAVKTWVEESGQYTSRVDEVLKESEDDIRNEYHSYARGDTLPENVSEENNFRNHVDIVTYIIYMMY